MTPTAAAGRRPDRRTALGWIATATLIATAGGCRERAPAEPPQAGSAAQTAAEAASAPSPEPAPVRVVHPAAPGSFVDAVADIRPSIVTLRSPRKVVGGPGTELFGATDPNALGSGFAVAAGGKAYVVTADQVLGNATEIEVVLAGDPARYEARVLGRDAALNVALLDVADAKLTPAPMGRSADARVGEWVVAVGVPFGYGPSVATGVLGSLDASASEGLAAPGQSRYAGYLQLDAAIHEGHAGGPVLDMSGDVIGVAAALVPGARRNGYAVPIDQVLRVLPQLRDRGAVSRGWLGVRVQPVTAALAQGLGMAEASGAYVTEVVPGQPGATGGLAAGDVIVALNGDYVDERNLPGVVAAVGADAKLSARVWRGGAFQTLELVTAAVPE